MANCAGLSVATGLIATDDRYVGIMKYRPTIPAITLRNTVALAWVIGTTVVGFTTLHAQDNSIWPLVKPEQRRIRYRDSTLLPDVYVAQTPPPPTVSDRLPPEAERLLPLDEAIQLALNDSEVVRQLAGSIAVSSGRTIYDPAIANNAVDQQRAAFDPTLEANNTWTQTEPPTAFLDPGSPTGTSFGGVQAENHNVSVGLSQRNLAGGTARFGFGNEASRFSPGLFALNPANRYSTELSYTQPLLRGGGVLANRTPIILAQIDTERSFFQFRDDIQELVRGTIDAYWAVVFARTDVWAREIQVNQAEELVRFSEARQKTGFANITEVAQAQSALAQFRASLVFARANLLTREAALQNILGIPPTLRELLTPSTPPTTERIQFDWNEITTIAQQRRPDLIELKLVLEADQQRVLLANNQARPSLDLVSIYRWNGLEGRTPSGARVGSTGDQYQDWTLGVNFSVPLFLRSERASLRSAQLVVARDRANLTQGVHNARHLLALRIRNLYTFYEQYEAFRIAREAAKRNLSRQFAAYRTGNPVLFVNVLQAISDWGNSVSQEAQAVTQYNTELANLERESGTILETHGIFFNEDRFCSLGPVFPWRLNERAYPRDIRPTENIPRYPAGSRPAENTFDLNNYPRRLPRTDKKDENTSPAEPVPAPPAAEVSLAYPKLLIP